MALVPPVRPLDRRRLLLGALGFALAGLSGCRELVTRWLTRHDNSELVPVSHSFEDSDLCVLTAEAIEGPYFIENAPVRRDVREGRPGRDLRLGLRVVDADGCRPLPGASVVIWQCDALGNYAGHSDKPPDQLPRLVAHAEPVDQERFLRGVQTTDASGHVQFLTIVPGWYTPRTPHIHVKVVVAERALLTAQLYLPQEWIDEVEREAPYRERAPSPYTNRNDFVIHESAGANGGWLRMSRDGETWVGSVTLGLAAAAR